MIAAADMSPREVAALKRVHRETVVRWMLDGVRSAAGDRVRLGARKVGGRWRITVEDLREFDRATNHYAAPIVRTRRRHAAIRHRRAMGALGALGILGETTTGA